MTQKKLTCAVMRGGTSKGVYLLREQLPADPAALRRVLLAVMGSPDARQIDGLGGGEMLTSKVAMVAKSAAADADIDYHFAQVVPGKSEVDTSPTCGNILSGVGAFAIEFGLFPAADGETELVVRDVNTGAFVEQVVQTPGGRVEYAGDCVISGAPGSAAPVALNYLRFAGVKTGRLFPAGAGVVEVDGIETTCIDAAMPVVFAAAESFGLSGRESAAELQADRNFFARMESVRLAASEKMGLGDARGKVIPKFALVASPEGGGGGRERKGWEGGGGGGMVGRRRTSFRAISRRCRRMRRMRFRAGLRCRRRWRRRGLCRIAWVGRAGPGEIRAGRIRRRAGSFAYRIRRG